jgi:hypothetical protein
MTRSPPLEGAEREVGTYREQSDMDEEEEPPRKLVDHVAARVIEDLWCSSQIHCVSFLLATF